MTQQAHVPPPMDGRDPSNLRADPITGDRYFSHGFAHSTIHAVTAACAW
ncbi:hypothetical protein [Croceicoccus hydrothermalis]|nr:hypothetical protein [Croceicoccus hydrothermalis]